MKNFFPKIILLLLSSFLFGIISFNFFKVFSFPDQDWNIEREEKTVLNKDNPVVQKFKATRKNLSQIKLLFSQSDKKKIGGQIKMQLAEENCQDIIAEDFLKVSSINSEFTYNFNFPKIKESENKTFCLMLFFVPEMENKKNPQIFLSKISSPEKQISLMDVKEKILENRSLSMRPAYKNDNIWQDMTELNKRISQYKPWFLKHYYLGFITISFIILSLVLMAILIII